MSATTISRQPAAAQQDLTTLVGAMAQAAAQTREFGFDKADKLAAPRSDAEVWSSIGLDVDTSDGIDDAELMQLAQLAASAPAEFIRRLREDSANGTPIKYHREIADSFGVVVVDLSIENGELSSSVELQLDDLRSDFEKYFAKPMASDKVPAIALTTSGKLEENGNLDGVKLAVELKNIPAFNVAELSGEKEALEGLEQANKIENADERMEELRWIHDTIYSELERVLAKVFAEFVDDAEPMSIVISPDDYDVDINVRLGNGEYSISADHIIPDATVNVRASVAGHTEEWGEVIAVDSAKIDIANSLGVLVPETGNLEDVVVTADGKPVPREEAEMLAMFAMMALGFLTGESPF